MMHVEDRSMPLYLCFYCYDELHPNKLTGNQEADAYCNHVHDDYASPAEETFQCTVCQAKKAELYCRDGNCKGALFCNVCWAGVHGHGDMSWHEGTYFS